MFFSGELFAEEYCIENATTQITECDLGEQCVYKIEEKADEVTINIYQKVDYMIKVDDDTLTGIMSAVGGSSKDAYLYFESVLKECDSDKKLIVFKYVKFIDDSVIAYRDSSILSQSYLESTIGSNKDIDWVIKEINRLKDIR